MTEVVSGAADVVDDVVVGTVVDVVVVVLGVRETEVVGLTDDDGTTDVEEREASQSILLLSTLHGGVLLPKQLLSSSTAMSVAIPPTNRKTLFLVTYFMSLLYFHVRVRARVCVTGLLQHISL